MSVDGVGGGVEVAVAVPGVGWAVEGVLLGPGVGCGVVPAGPEFDQSGGSVLDSGFEQVRVLFGPVAGAAAGEDRGAVWVVAVGERVGG